MVVKLSQLYIYTTSVSDWVFNGSNGLLPLPVAAPSKAARLLRLWVRIPPGYGCLSVVSGVS